MPSSLAFGPRAANREFVDLCSARAYFSPPIPTILSRYSDKLAAMVNRRQTGESSGDRLVRQQPMCLAEGKSIWQCDGDLSVINVRRCREAAVHLMLADLPCEAVAELCDFEGLCARIRCGEGYNVIAQLGTSCRSPSLTVFL